MKSRVYIVLPAVVMMLVAASLGAGIMPLTQIDSKPDARIDIIPIDEEHSSAIPGSLKSLPLSFPPGSFLLVNRTGTPITAVDVRWNYTDDKGQLKQRGITCDAYAFAPLDPIVEAHDLSLITPYGCTRQSLFAHLGTGNFIGGSPLAATAGAPVSADLTATIHLYIDSAIFADGQICGPDKFQYFLQIQDRYLAVKNFVAEVEAGRNAGENLTTLLTRVRNDARSKADTGSSRASSRRAYYAGLLLRSPNAEGSLQQLKAQVPPPAFVHTGGQN